MHRSGTSVAARLANLVGGDLGDHLLAPRPDNPKGFWEHAGVFEAHEQYLRAAHCTWSHPGTAAEILSDETALNDLGIRIAAILQRDLKGERIAIKDPRTCRLLPVWKNVTADLDIQPSYWIVYRNPREVARSLFERDGIPASQSHLLWYRYVSESERATRGARRAFLDFERLLVDWRSAMRETWAALDLPWTDPVGSAQAEIERFIEREMRHHHGDHSPEENAVLTDLALPAYEGLRRGGPTGTEISAVMDQLTQRLTDYDAAYEAMRMQWARQNAELAAAVHALKHSTSWRLTAPLRTVVTWWRAII